MSIGVSFFKAWLNSSLNPSDSGAFVDGRFELPCLSHWMS